MIEITKTEVSGFRAALRGMRNPMNSWSKSDSNECGEYYCEDCVYYKEEFHAGCDQYKLGDYVVGPNDLELARKLTAAGPVHSKFLRMIHVQMDVNAPRYWWAEMDTYKVSTVRNSCSTMHKIHSKEFTLDDFSHDKLQTLSWEVHSEKDDLTEYRAYDTSLVLEHVIIALNIMREQYIRTKDKIYWWQMIQLLPSSYNQLATLDLNYETLRNIYRWRKDHKLDEWHVFCEWIENLPYSELITMSGKESSDG